jgi:hypothetical protein
MDFLGKQPTGFVRPKSLAGLRFIANDADITIGEGEDIHGRGIDLVMAMCGRRHAFASLDGPGAEILQARFT